MNRLRMKIFPAIYIILFSGQIFAVDFDYSGQMDIEWKPHLLLLNKENPLNPDNFLQNENLINQAEANLWFDLYIGSFDISGNFLMSIDSGKSQRFINDIKGTDDYSELKLASLGFQQLFVRWNLSNGWRFGLGKYPLRHGYSRVYAPMNYNARMNDFRSTLGQWNVWFAANIGDLEYTLRYYPVFEYRDNPNEKNETERFFSWTETSLKQQMLSLQLSFFLFDSIDSSILFFIQDRDKYSLENVYLAGALGFSWSVTDNFIFRAEGLVGNGFNDLKKVGKSTQVLPPGSPPLYTYSERDLTSVAFKFLGGFTTILPLDIEVSLEYYYNGAAYSNEEREDFIDAALNSAEHYENSNPTIAGLHRQFLGNGWSNWRIYDVGRHYLFLQFMRREIGNRLDILNTSILLLSDYSFYNSTEFDFSFNDNFAMGLKAVFFLFEKKDAFVLSPNRMEAIVSLKYSL